MWGNIQSTVIFSTVQVDENCNRNVTILFRLFRIFYVSLRKNTK